MICIENIRTQSNLTLPEVALTIGNFDGCHRGHQDLIARAKSFAVQHNLQPAVMTFDPSPESYFRPADDAIPRLFTTKLKVRSLEELGVEVVVVENFDDALAGMSHEDFFHDLLLEKLSCRALVVGYDFKFGRDRKGNSDYLRAACNSKDIAFQEGTSIKHEETAISSTRIRQALNRGNIEDCAAMLGRPYMLAGKVGRGEQKGRTIGFPTANLDGWQQLIPRIGVYCGYAYFGDKGTILEMPTGSLPVVINVGNRPTVANESRLQIEAHVIDGSFGPDELYDQEFQLFFVERLRDEQKFAGLAELKSAIAQDISHARRIL